MFVFLSRLSKKDVFANFYGSFEPQKCKGNINILLFFNRKLLWQIAIVFSLVFRNIEDRQSLFYLFILLTIDCGWTYSKEHTSAL